MTSKQRISYTRRKTQHDHALNSTHSLELNLFFKLFKNYKVFQFFFSYIAKLKFPQKLKLFLIIFYPRPSFHFSSDMNRKWLWTDSGSTMCDREKFFTLSRSLTNHLRFSCLIFISIQIILFVWWLYLFFLYIHNYSRHPRSANTLPERDKNICD
jgi:hypothetical protein